MIDADRLLTHTLVTHPRGEAVARILAAAINAVAPDEVVRRFAYRQGDQLFIRQTVDDPVGQSYDLGKTRQIFIFGLGKAAEAMSLTLAEMLADQSPRGLLVVKHLVASLPDGFEEVVGGHPVPNQGSLLAAKKLLELLTGIHPEDLLICLISGGGSALISAPVSGVSLKDMQSLTALLLACGARIDEINTLRRHLDQVKGGGLAQMAAPARVISLILSDVVGSPLEAIASGPTAPDPSSRQEALAILEKYHLIKNVPVGILAGLKAAVETPKPGQWLFDRVQNVLVGNNYLAAQAALQQASLEGFFPLYLRGDLQGEARTAALELCQELRVALQNEKALSRPFCLVAGGETTVSMLASNTGRGGRNQELALAAVNEMEGLPGSLLVSLATDGEDGPTDAAGAVVSPETRLRGAKFGLDPLTFLSRHDAYTYFSRLDDLLKPGPTGTNVNDLTFLFGF